MTKRIDNIVLYGRSNYAALVPSLESNAGSNNIYTYYSDSGYASFWPKQLGYVPNAILENIVNSPTVTTYGNVALPEASITGDPLLCSVFELNNNSSQLMNLSKQVYSASEAYNESTNKYAAFSEGNGFSGYIWEWVVTSNGTTWTITGSDSSYLDNHPIIYTKVAFSFLALYNSSFARNMVVYLEQTLPYPSNGYWDGATNTRIMFPISAATRIV